MPILNWIMSFCFVFTRIEWARQNLALFVILMAPTFCLINSKMIVCNFTKMEVEAFAFNCVYVMLFQFNMEVLENKFEESTIAMAIFATDITTYMVFVYCTIK